MTSTLALVILALFVPFSIGSFFAMRPLTAFLVVVLGADMFLPVEATFKLPLLPALGKINLPYMCILIACLLKCPGKLAKLPKDKWIVFCVLLGLIGGITTALTNSDALIFGGEEGRVIPGLTLKDGFFIGITEFFPNIISLFLGYTLVRDAKDIERTLVALAIGGLIYCPFAIIEMRMSPQFHQWVYGYSSGQFAQTIRWGGYRPVVFMGHGLALARFFVAATVALFVLAKTRRNLFGLPVYFLAWFQLVVLVLCKSTGAIIQAVVGILLVSLTKSRQQLLFASVLAFATILYPLLRATNIFPVAGVLDAADAFGEDRSGSLAFRFANEDRLLARARERIWFGWGAGRGRVFDDDGRDTTIVDGYWIGCLGMIGLNGFLISFGSLLWPVIAARNRLRDHGDKLDRTHLAGIAVIIGLIGSDLIPNGLWSMLPFLLAGMLMRRLRELEPTASLKYKRNNPMRCPSNGSQTT